MTAPTTAHFLTDIEIKEFKCFKDFKASGFKRVNLIGGKNNVGKTAFMEACYINVYGDNFSNLLTVIAAIKFSRENLNFVGKEIDTRLLLESTKYYSTKSNIHTKVFYIKEDEVTREYCSEINNKKSIVNPDKNYIITSFIDNSDIISSLGWDNIKLSSEYQNIQKKDKESELNDLIKKFDSSIENFKVIGDKPQCKTNGEYRDIVEFGDGLKHYISIICALYACENGYLFIDEIDNGIYYDHLDRLWEIIFTLSKKTNCQIFATTHSKEMLESFARVAKKLDEQDISFTTLVKNKNQEIKALTRDYEMILDSIEDGREVR